MPPVQPVLSNDEARQILRPLLAHLVALGVPRDRIKAISKEVYDTVTKLVEFRGTAARTFSADGDPGGRGANFSADAAHRYGSYFLPDDAGLYPGTLHRQFGLGVQDFSDAAKMRRAHRNGRWYWEPRPTN